MIRHIAKKEFHQNILTSRFVIGTFICVIFMIAVKLVLIDEYRVVLNSYNQNLRENEERLKNYQVYSRITSDALKPPEPLAVFSEGLSKSLTGFITIRRNEVPLESANYVLDNPLLNLFKSIDVVLVFKFVMSLLALLFAFDMFSGEKDNGTLKLCLSSQLSRAQLFTGKFIGGMLSFSLALLISFIVGLILLFFSSHIKITPDILSRILLIYAVSIIFTTSFFIIGALISSLTHRAVTSLAMSLFIWVVLAIALPNLGDYIASRLKEVEPAYTVQNRIENIQNEFRETRKGFFEKNSPESWTMWGSTERFRIANKEYVDFMKIYIPFIEEKRRENADKVYAVKKEYLDRLLEQADIVNNLTIFSPVRLYDLISSRLARTDINDYLDYLEQSRIYREQILQYYDDRNLYHNQRFFTILEPGPETEITIEEYRKNRTRWDNLLEKYNWDTYPPINLNDFPRFNFRPAALIDSIYGTLPYIAFLIFFILALFAITYFSFVRYDVR